MKALELKGIRELEVTERPEPVIKNDDDVKLKIEMVGVCGSDVHYYETGRIGSQVVDFPFIVGHECSATVVETGISVTGLKKGDRIVVEPAISCFNCDQCNKGREHTCRNLKFLGCPGQVEGCLCEYIVMPSTCCFKVGEDFSFEDGVLCEPFAIGVYAVQQACLDEGSDIAILGAGPIGLSCLKAAQIENINKVLMTEKIPERVKTAEKAGADKVLNPLKEDVIKEGFNFLPPGYDTVFECAGQQETLDQAIEFLKPGGKLMVIGIPREERVSFVIDKIRRKEITIVNVRRQNKCTQKAIDLISSKNVDLGFMVTHKFSFEDAEKAFDLVANYSEGVVKALIEF